MPRQVDHDGRIVPHAGQPASQPMRGLGDAVARVTQALGVPQCAPCAQRQVRLNQLWPFAGPNGSQ